MAVSRARAHPEDMAPARVVDLHALRARGDAAIARVAAEPVRHVPTEFVAALLCLPLEDLDADARPALRAVPGGR